MNAASSEPEPGPEPMNPEPECIEPDNSTLNFILVHPSQLDEVKLLWKSLMRVDMQQREQKICIIHLPQRENVLDITE